MPYPTPTRLTPPLPRYKVSGRAFLEEGILGGQSWGLHLGEDVLAEPGTAVTAIGDGEVVYAALHQGTRRRGNWGHIIICGHAHAGDGRAFFSVYGHLGELRAAVGARVTARTVLGPVGEGRTPANGYWPEPHLHFAVYTGPWEGKVLPGYFQADDHRTKVEYWLKPSAFVRAYPRVSSSPSSRVP